MCRVGKLANNYVNNYIQKKAVDISWTAAQWKPATVFHEKFWRLAASFPLNQNLPNKTCKYETGHANDSWQMHETKGTLLT